MFKYVTATIESQGGTHLLAVPHLPSLVNVVMVFVALGVRNPL